MCKSHIITNSNIFIFFQSGDVIESEIVGIGKMRNPVVAPQ